MWDPSVKERVERLAEEIVGAEGFDLVQARVRLRGRRRTITLFIDRPGFSVLLDDCARISRLVEDALDRQDLIQGRYVLEVSSPGLDRALRGEKDFVRFQGRRARLTTRKPVQGRGSFEGVLGEVNEGVLGLELDSGETVLIPLVEISSARLEVEF